MRVLIFLQSLYQAFLEVCNFILRILNIQIWKMCFFALQFVRILDPLLNHH